ARAPAGGKQDLVARERAVRDRVVDARQVLAHDRAGAEVEVADLGVAHLPLGQPDGAPAGGQLRVRVPGPELVEDRGVGPLDRVAGAGRREPPAVEDDQADRPDRERPGSGGPVHERAAATTTASFSASRLAPPTSAPST